MITAKLAKKYNVDVMEIQKAFLISDAEFNLNKCKVPTPESLCEHWFGDKTLPPIWRVK